MAFVEATAILLGHGFIVARGGGHGAGDRIEEHEFQEADGGEDLRIRKPVDEFVCVLFIRDRPHTSRLQRQYRDWSAGAGSANLGESCPR